MLRSLLFLSVVMLYKPSYSAATAGQIKNNQTNLVSQADQANQVNQDARPNEPPYTNVEESDLSNTDSEPEFGLEPETKINTRSKSATAEEPAGKARSDKATAEDGIVTSEATTRAEKKPKEANKIAHPNAEKGLYLIDRTTGNYYYKVETLTKKESTMSLRVGSYETPAITSSSSSGDITYSDIYGDSAPVILMYDYEWSPFRKIKNLNVQIGGGLFVSQGNGILESSTGPVEAKERYTLFVLPINLGLAYRFQFWPKQWLVPYVAGGGTYFALIETRDDGKKTAAIGTPAAYGAGGFMINLGAIDRQAAFTFDREYGINNFWLSGEFRVYQSFSDDVDISSNVINFGVTVDY